MFVIGNKGSMMGDEEYFPFGFGCPSKSRTIPQRAKTLKLHRVGIFKANA